MEGKIVMTVETFGRFISYLIASGVTYELDEVKGKDGIPSIEVTFTGGY